MIRAMMGVLVLLGIASMIFGTVAMILYAIREPRYRVVSLLAAVAVLIMLVSAVQGWLNTLR